jgi:uncharacterized protein (DUF58 family)
MASNAFETTAVKSRWEPLRKTLRLPMGLFRKARKAAPPVSTRFTREGMQVLFMAIFVLLGAIIRDVNLLIVLAGTLLATLLIQWRICAKTLIGLTTYRRLPRSMHARKAFEIDLVITNPKRWLGAWLILAHDRLKYVSQDTSTQPISQAIGLLYSSIAPNTTRIQRYRCVMERCGQYQFLGIELTTRFPFGLLRGILTYQGGDNFTVQPAIGRLLPAWTGLFGLRTSGVKQRQARSLSDEGDFFGLRAYRPGDSPRWIHWRSSARRDELVVKQFQQADSRELVILLDLHTEHSTDPALLETHRKRADLAIEFVATLVNHIASTNFGVVTVAIADAEPTVASRIQSRSQCSGLLDRLAVAHGGEEDKISTALSLLELEFRRIENLLVVSTRPRSSFHSANHSNSNIVFWKSMNWLDVSHPGELSHYFVPAE